MSTNHENSNDEWAPCPPGTLIHQARRLRSKRRREKMLALAGASFVLLLALGLGIASWNHSGPEQRPGDGGFLFGGIACTDVRDQLQAYVAGTLPENMAAKIRTHLEECPACQELMRSMEPIRTSILVLPKVKLPHRAAACPCEQCRTEGLAA